MKKNIHIPLSGFFILLIVALIYVKINFPTIDIDQIIFCAKYGLSSSDFTPLFVALKICIPIYIILLIILITLSKTILKKNTKHILIFASLSTLICSLYTLSIPKYLYNKNVSSNFIENNYYNVNKDEIIFNKKNNLIMIVLESFETSIIDKENNGLWDYNLLPEITKLNKEKDTTVFYNTDNEIGFKMIDGANFTSAALISHTSSIPFKYKLFSRINKENILNGAYSLGDILHDNGYQNELISAASTSFGEVNDYFKKHGQYNIIDINTLNDNNFKLSEDDQIGWGFSDGYMYKIAKERLNTLNNNNKPFNLTLVGIDTHFPEGYKTTYTIDKYEKQYENVYASESIQLYNFINWIKEQEFYKDTTIVIVGDHLSMQEDFFKNVEKNKRYVYAAYINPVNDAYNTKNRKYTALDTMPTTLGALGAKIKTNKIALGTNMFSNEKTLAETYGYTKLNKELNKKSKFYYEKFYK